MHTFDLNLERITKVEGSAALSVSVKDDKVETVQFRITEFKRFYTKAMRGKPIIALPQLLARICGTRSNAPLLAGIEACEDALGMGSTPQTERLRDLVMYGLNIRDHALHIYLFSMPDIIGKDSFLEFDENIPEEDQLLHDAFAIKAAGNHLATIIAGRSVHGLYPTIGGFLRFPTQDEVKTAIGKLNEVRPAVLRLIAFLKDRSFTFERETNYVALRPERYGFRNGCLSTAEGVCLPETAFADFFERVALPYSQATGFTHAGKEYMVGALSRMNLNKDALHPRTKESAKDALALFPSKNIYFNNLAQAIEILHSVDDALELLETHEIKPEPLVKGNPREATGIGIVEAPRGTLLHKVTIDAKSIVTGGEIVVPTGQNQINIEKDIAVLVGGLLETMPKEKIEFEMEKLIRAYDPCMSCAAHFLKVKWSVS